MRKVVLLVMLLFGALPIATAAPDEALHLTITMQRGESGRDSHSQKVTVAITGHKLTYTKTYTGRLRDRAPIAKDLEITAEDVRHISDWIKAENLLVTENLERQGAPKGTYFWFDLRIQSAVGSSSGLINIRGPRTDETVLEAPLYKRSASFIEKVFAIIHRIDKSIVYEELVP